MRLLRRSKLFPAALLAAHLGLAAVASAQDPKITQLSRLPAGTSASDYALLDYKVSPDGEYVVYCTQSIVPEFWMYTGSCNAVWVVPSDGSRAPRRLSGPPPSGTDVNGNPAVGAIRDYDISPDGRYVVFEADQRVYNKFEVYSVPIAGGTPRVISSPVGGADADVNGYVISPDGRHVVYQWVLYSSDSDSVFETLYSVPIGGGASFKLSQSISGCPGVATDVKTVDFSPDGRYVLFHYTPTEDSPRCPTPTGSSDQIPYLYSVPLAGGTARLLSTKFYGDGTMVTPNSALVTFQADFVDDGYDGLQLYSVPITGGPRRLLSRVDERVPENTEDVRQYQMADAYGAVVYGYRRNGNHPYYEPYMRDLTIAAADGTFRQPLPPFGKDIINFLIVPGNRGVVAKVSIPDPDPSPDPERYVGRRDKLFSFTPQSGWRARQISKETGDEVLDGYHLLEDGVTVTYQESRSRAVYSAPVDGGAAPRLLVAQTDVYRLTPDQEHVVYPGVPEDPGADGAGSSLQITPVAGGAARTLVPNGVSVSLNNALYRVVATADGRRAVYVGVLRDADGNVVRDELYGPVERLFSVTLPRPGRGRAVAASDRP